MGETGRWRERERAYSIGKVVVRRECDLVANAFANTASVDDLGEIGLGGLGSHLGVLGVEDLGVFRFGNLVGCLNVRVDDYYNKTPCRYLYLCHELSSSLTPFGDPRDCRHGGMLDLTSH